MADLESQKIRKTKQINFKLIVFDILLVILERLTMWLLLTYPSFVYFFCSTGFTPLRLHISVSYGYLTEDLTSVALGEYYLLLLIERFVSFAAIYLYWPTNFWCIVVVSCSAISTICSATIARSTYFIFSENRKEKQKEKDYRSSSPNPDSPPSYDPPLHFRDRDLSDDPAHASSSSANRRGDRKKRAIPWTEEEHRMFLIGLEKLGKGDWRGIARNYVTTRTPTQVASHAHRYFTRQSTSSSSDPPHMPEEQALLLGSSMVA